jgi:hypothetical protein
MGGMRLGGNGGRSDPLEVADRCGSGSQPSDAGVVPPDGNGADGGRSREESVYDPNAQAWDVHGLYVVDGAVLPIGLGVI